ncbi:phosphatidylglycerophosphatase A [candidate division GN15 bacterium]|uniref:Phosphatidylglycerophosphatase A n=1 Tax=candidate division GN15 bacterium TaxID=2072418 RepID=A0A855X2S9_9BACT|nr:MAG: phosphatidylglycerophosphatase A [candidate division GN15 bacterium]
MPVWLTRILATGLYTGLSPSIPGTTGTVPAWLLLWFLLPQNWVVQTIVLIVILGISVWLATEAEGIFGHDSKKIVIDEWAGMMVAVLFLPHTLTAYLLAFGAFRLFDVVKLWPAAQLERLPSGWGVTMDDVAAGVQANILVRIIILIIARV